MWSLFEIVAHGVLNIALDSNVPSPKPTSTPKPSTTVVCNQDGLPNNEGPWVGRVCHEVNSSDHQDKGENK